MPRLAQITVYPIKSLDGVALASATFNGFGGLEHDRRFAIRSVDGKFVNGKRYAAIHAIRASFDLAAASITLSAPDRAAATFPLAGREPKLEAWLSDYFGFACTLDENAETGFPDDLDSPGPTLISRATLRRVAEWFPPLSLDEVRRRFRANLEIDSSTDTDDCPAFWEDRLFGYDAVQGSRSTVPFSIGDVRLEGVNPCARCVVPSRDATTGEVRPRFAVEFAKQREAELPAWAGTGAFDHFYRLAVNTRAPAAAGKTIWVGDDVQAD